MITQDRIIQLMDQAPRVIPHPNRNFPPSLYYRFFKLLTAEIKPKLSVVLGVCGGGDCLYMLDGHSEGQVHGIDVAYDHPVQILTIKGLHPNFKFVKGDSIESAKDYANKSVDLLFIDTIHLYEHTMAEYNAWKPKMVDAGIICLDDLFRDHMQRAWDEIPGRAKIRRDELHIGGGFDDGGFGVILL
jgi:hypothetical protein